ncbi:MAG: SDR family oxidoreductase [Acidobacteriaceae bacterium]|nr:SDR family oxidoreductase [Acidobacteriaceae bacterium]
MPRTLVAITGASSGIGATFARKLAPEHDLLLIARRRDRLEQLAQELHSQYGTECDVFEADLTVDEDLDRVAERVANDPRLVLLINNAGFGTKGRFWESPLEIQKNMHKLHVMAPVRLTHAALRNMVPRDIGGIINVASVSAFVRNSGSVSYGATKSWMTSFSEGLYLELKAMQSNVVVQALCPGFTYSEFHDTMAVDRHKLAASPYWLSAEEVVDASLAGLHRRKLFVIPGWRYRLIVTFLTKIPTAVRLLVERVATRSRQRAMGIEAPQPKQVTGR